MLVIKLKSKLFMIIPPAAAVIAFAVCIILTNYKQPAKAVFIADGDAQMIVVSNDGKTVLYDVANASSDMYYDGYDISCEYGGSKIDSIIYACFNELQPDILLRIGKSTIVDEIRLPQPKTDKDIAVAENLLSVAENIGASVLIYNDEEFFLSEKETSVYIDIENEGAAVVSIYSGETMINFFDPSVTDKDLSNIVNSGEIAILSSGFDKKLESKIVLSGEILEKFLFASEKAYNKNAIETNGIPIYVNKEKYKTWNVSFLLE